MEDLRHIVSLGFSGSDIVRAVLIAFAFAIIIGKRRSAWTLGAIALVIDRVIWPVAGMAFAGAENASIWGALGGLGKTFVDDLGVYVVRYLGLVIMIALFISMRAGLHTRLSPPKKAAA